MQQTSWIVARLIEETRVHHADAAGDRLAVMQKPTEESYRAFLCHVYGFEAPLEARFTAMSGFDGGLLHTHMKSGHLVADLDALGVIAGGLEWAPTVIRDDVAEALAWMYVLERNTLFHGLMFRHLAAKLPGTMQRAGAYLTAHESIGGRLRELGAVLDHSARRTQNADRMVRAANEAFRYQRQWYARGSARSRRMTDLLDTVRYPSQ